MSWSILERPAPLTAPRPTGSDRLRVLAVSESFLPQVNGVTNSVRRVLEHLAAEGHVAELVAPTGPASYAGFPVTVARGASLPFYRDFRIGLETRRRLRFVMQRFRPDVVHLASPATLGHQAALVAEELGIPAVAVYQTDLVGFALRYGIAGGPRAMARLTTRIHGRVARTLAPSSASMRQLADLGIGDTHLWPRGVDLEGFHPGRRDEALREQLAPDGRLLVGYVGRLAAEKELDDATEEKLAEIYEEINGLERSEISVKQFREYRELFGWLLIPSVALMIGVTFINQNIFRKRA